MDPQIKPWCGEIDAAVRVIDLVEEALPITEKNDRSRAIEILRLRQKNFQKGTFLVWIDNQVQGFVMLSKTGSPDVTDVAGIVHPNYHRRGIGRALLAKALNVLKDRSVSGKLRVVAFESNPSGRHFLENHGFEATDKQVWSELSTEATFDDCSDGDTDPLSLAGAADSCTEPTPSESFTAEALTSEAPNTAAAPLFALSLALGLAVQRASRN